MNLACYPERSEGSPNGGIALVVARRSLPMPSSDYDEASLAYAPASNYRAA